MMDGQLCTTCLLDRDALVRLDENQCCALCEGRDPTPTMTEPERAYYESEERQAVLASEPVPGETLFEALTRIEVAVAARRAR